MAQPRFEVATGTIDAVNTVFNVSTPYKVGTTAVYINGQLKNRTFSDGWTETNPFEGEVTLFQAPLPGDIVQVFFIDTSPALLEEEISPISGKFKEIDIILGRYEEVGALSGRYYEVDNLKGSIDGQ